jgi:WD40 repeat protein
MATIKVLLFAANPHGTAPLDLPREFREIDEEVRMGPFRTAVELILVPGARPVDLLRKLNENRPQVVHFSSHGNPDEIVLESGDDAADAPGLSGVGMRSTDERDMKSVGPGAVEGGSGHQAQPHALSKSALVNVLRSCDEGNLRLVVLNACHTRSQAEALTAVVDCVVSMNRTVSDRAAIKFAASFYGALAFGRSVQTAFDQGVARLSAEGIGETETPELLVRAGVDASRVVLVGSRPGPVATPVAEAPFIVPFPRNEDFVGRDGDLVRLHASLSGSDARPVGIRPAGLTGMGGIGKTQLAVEYVHRQREDYPDGIFWIDAAGPLAEGFARLATDPRLRWAEPDRPRDEQIRAAFSALDGRSRALLVLDNLPDPSAIAVPLLPGCVPEDLRSRLLFTTRRHDLGRFVGVEVTVLPEEPALRLLLRHPSCRAALDPENPDHEHARAIARMLGRLPLALELAGAYLGKYSGDITLESYREGLRSDGALATLDADAAELTDADLRRVHAPAVAATISEQWNALHDEDAWLLLRVAGQFPESVAVPAGRLGLLAGLSDEARPGRLSPLRRAVRRMDDACLIERLEADQVRLHPLVREFAAAQTPPDQVEDFRRRCLERAATALEHFPAFATQDTRRGVDALQQDLVVFNELCPASATDLAARLQALLRLLQREANHLCIVDAKSQPVMLAQLVQYRAALLGIISLKSSAEQWLIARGQPHFRLHWRASRESPALVRTLTGHEDWVTAVAVAPDGRRVLSGGYDGTLRVWDLHAGQLLRTIAGHETSVNAVAVTPDGRQALSASHDRTLKLWDLETGQLVRSFSGHEDGVTAVAVAPDGRRVLSGGHDGTLRLGDLRTGQLYFTFRVGADSAHHDQVWALAIGQLRFSVTGPSSPVSAVAVTPDSRHAVSASRNGSLRVWDLQTGQLLSTLVAQESSVNAVVLELDGPQDENRPVQVALPIEVSAVAVSSNGRHALSGCYDQTLRLWDLQTGQLLRTFVGHEDKVSAVVITAGGRQALSASHDRTLKLWDLQTGQLLSTLAGHEDGVSAVAVTPDGRHAISASGDRTLKLWDLTASQLIHTTTGHEAEVSSMAVTDDGRHALSASHDHTLRLWDLATGQPLRSFTDHDDRVSAVAIVAGGRHVLSGSHDRTLRLWDLATGQPLRTFTGHEDGVSAVALTSDGLRALSASHDRTLRLWDLATGQPLQTFVGHERAVSAVAVTPDNRHLLSGSADHTLRLWDLATGHLLCIMIGHVRAVGAVTVTPDGRHALSASSDRTLRLWDLATGQPLRTFAGHEGAVSAVAVTPDGRYALSASHDRTLRLWDIAEGACRVTALLESSPLAIALSPDGRTVVVGDQVGNVHHFHFHVD